MLLAKEKLSNDPEAGSTGRISKHTDSRRIDRTKRETRRKKNHRQTLSTEAFHPQRIRATFEWPSQPPQISLPGTKGHSCTDFHSRFVSSARPPHRDPGDENPETLEERAYHRIRSLQRRLGSVRAERPVSLHIRPKTRCFTRIESNRIESNQHPIFIPIGIREDRTSAIIPRRNDRPVRKVSQTVAGIDRSVQNRSTPRHVFFRAKNPMCPHREIRPRHPYHSYHNRFIKPQHCSF